MNEGQQVQRNDGEEGEEAMMAAAGRPLLDLTRIDIPADGCDTDITLIATDVYDLKDGSITIRTLQLNRVLTLEKLENKIQEFPPSIHSGFYSTCYGDVCYAINDGDQPKRSRTVFYPYCREPSIKRIEEHRFDKTGDSHGQFRWDSNVNDFAEIPGCRCRVKRVQCRQGICNRVWGTEIIHVACWSTETAHNIIERCAKNVNAGIRLARVKWTESGSGMISHEINGLLLEKKLVPELKKDLEWNMQAEKEEKEGKSHQE